MTTINLRNFYPWLTQDEYIDVPDEVAEAMLTSDRLERNYIRKVYYNKAHYSLDVGDGIEHSALYSESSPEELYMRKIGTEQLCAAFNSLSEIQGRRVDAHYILGMKKVEIAKAEGVTDSCVCDTIKNGIKNMRKYLLENF